MTQTQLKYITQTFWYCIGTIMGCFGYRIADTEADNMMRATFASLFILVVVVVAQLAWNGWKKRNIKC